MKLMSQRKAKQALDQCHSTGIETLRRSSSVWLLSSSSFGMSQLRCLKNQGLIARLFLPHAEDDPDPDICQSTDRHTMALALCSFALVIRSRPRLREGRLPGELMQGIAQRLQAGKAFVSFSKVATLERHRSCASQFLHTLGILVTGSVIAPFGQQAGSQTFGSTRQRLP